MVAIAGPCSAHPCAGCDAGKGRIRADHRIGSQTIPSAAGNIFLKRVHIDSPGVDYQLADALFGELLAKAKSLRLSKVVIRAKMPWPCAGIATNRVDLALLRGGFRQFIGQFST